MKILMLCVLLVGLAHSAVAGIYKWVDEDGKIHYTQKPPPKDGRRTKIDSSTFSNVQTVKAKLIPKKIGVVKRRTVTKKEKKKKEKVKRTSRTRCSRSR